MKKGKEDVHWLLEPFDRALKDYKRKIILALDEIVTKSPLCF